MGGGGESRDLRSVLDLHGADLVEAPLHDVLALQHELAALALEVLLLPHGDLELTHLLHLLSVHGGCWLALTSDAFCPRHRREGRGLETERQRRAWSVLCIDICETSEKTS